MLGLAELRLGKTMIPMKRWWPPLIGAAPFRTCVPHRSSFWFGGCFTCRCLFRLWLWRWVGIGFGTVLSTGLAPSTGRNAMHRSQAPSVLIGGVSFHTSAASGATLDFTSTSFAKKIHRDWLHAMITWVIMVDCFEHFLLLQHAEFRMFICLCPHTCPLPVFAEQLHETLRRWFWFRRWHWPLQLRSSIPRDQPATNFSKHWRLPSHWFQGCTTHVQTGALNAFAVQFCGDYRWGQRWVWHHLLCDVACLANASSLPWQNMCAWNVMKVWSADVHKVMTVDCCWFLFCFVSPNPMRGARCTPVTCFIDVHNLFFLQIIRKTEPHKFLYTILHVVPLLEWSGDRAYHEQTFCKPRPSLRKMSGPMSSQDEHRNQGPLGSHGWALWTCHWTCKPRKAPSSPFHRTL